MRIHPIPLDRELKVRLWHCRIWQEQILQTLDYRNRGEPVPHPDLPLLRKVLEHIDAHPGTWNQSTWNGCVIGWALHYAGVQLLPEDPTNHHAWLRLGAVTLRLLPVEAEFLADGDNDRIDIQTTARAIALRAGETL